MRAGKAVGGRTGAWTGTLTDKASRIQLGLCKPAGGSGRWSRFGLLIEVVAERHHECRSTEENELGIDRAMLVSDSGNDCPAESVVVERNLVLELPAVSPERASGHFQVSALVAFAHDEPALACIDIDTVLIERIAEINRAHIQPRSFRAPFDTGEPRQVVMGRVVVIVIDVRSEYERQAAIRQILISRRSGRDQQEYEANQFLQHAHSLFTVWLWVSMRAACRRDLRIGAAIRATSSMVAGGTLHDPRRTLRSGANRMQPSTMNRALCVLSRIARIPTNGTWPRVCYDAALRGACACGFVLQDGPPVSNLI